MYSRFLCRRWGESIFLFWFVRILSKFVWSKESGHQTSQMSCNLWFFFFSYQCWFMYLLGSVCVHSLVFEFLRNVMVVQISHHVMVCCDFLLFNGSICLFYGICDSRLSTIEKKHEVIETVSKKTIDLVRNSYFPLNIYEKMVWYCVISAVWTQRASFCLFKFCSF